MSGPRDLTRWNRAGLRRFRYVQGNAADYLELLRAELASADRFPEWTALQVGQDVDEGAQRRRVLAQYLGERRDFAWEIARSFARASHVLSEHLDAFANEGFVETATQWDFLRRLVEMLGYDPAPPASASTVLVLAAKPGAIGTVSAGFQVKHAPQSGAAPVVFETLADLGVDEGLNALRLSRWNRSEQDVAPFTQGAASPWREVPDMELSAGQPALLCQEPAPSPAPGARTVVSAFEPVELSQIDSASGAVSIATPGATSVQAAAAVAWVRGFTRLLAGPKKILRPRLNGPGLVQLDRAHGLTVGDVVAWQEGAAWKFGLVSAADATTLQLQGGAVPAAGDLFRAAAVLPVTDDSGAAPITELRVSLRLAAAAKRTAGGAVAALDLGKDFRTVTSPTGQAPLYLTLRDAAGVQALQVVLSGTPPAGRVAPRSQPVATYVFDGSPAGLASGDLLVADFRDALGLAVRRPARIARIEAREGEFSLVLQDPAEATAAQVPAGALAELIRNLRRIEAILDQPVFNELRVSQLVDGSAANLPASAIEGVGALGSKPASWGDRLGMRGVSTIRALASLRPDAAVEGVPATMLRELRTRAEQIVSFPTELGAASALLGARAAAVVALEASGSVAGKGALELERIHGPFRYQLHPPGHDRNALALPDPSWLTLALSPAEQPGALKLGRILLIEKEGGGAAHQTVVAAVDPGGELLRVRLAEPLPDAAAFTLGNAIVRGNVVRAGHGESKGERLLGSGDAAQLDQEFTLEVAGISFVGDSTMPAGVRADVTVRVDAELWQQVPSLRDSGPADPHYTVRMTEEGFLRIGFGDGQHGRRLPTGTNNVRVRYRVGSGVGGNLPAGALEHPVRPHQLVATVRQPLPSAGGDDVEPVSSLRERAPASVLTLERAVALDDFANLAASQSGVWQARAFRRATSLGRSEQIDVVLVPAGGAPLDDRLEPQQLPTFLAQQLEALQRAAPSATAVAVRLFEPVIVSLMVEVRVKYAEYDPTGVVERVRAALWEAFGLRRRRLGQSLYRSELYKVVEDVEGVENSDCAATLASPILAGRARRVVMQLLAGNAIAETVIPRDWQVVYLDPERSTVSVTPKEYEL